MKCKNCGHDLVNCGIHPHKDIIIVKSSAYCGFKTAKNVFCGCTKPEPIGGKSK